MIYIEPKMKKRVELSRGQIAEIREQLGEILEGADYDTDTDDGMEGTACGYVGVDGMNVYVTLEVEAKVRVERRTWDNPGYTEIVDKWINDYDIMEWWDDADEMDEEELEAWKDAIEDVIDGAVWESRRRA